MFTVGDTVGAYEIVAELKSGGMATLFLGRRAGAAGFAKLVAIKVVHEHLAQDPTFVQMFVDEALLSARIEHPNVVHVEELCELDGRHFLVMEFVYGTSLGQLLRELGKLGRRLSPELAIYIAIKVADGLHAAHEVRDSSGESLGVVHRDISPQNILLAYQGNVKLIDFGVAKARGAAKTMGGNIKGKFRYMSPEQAHARELDRRSDIYALGIVLWEMLTMRRRFHAKSDMEVLDIVRNPEPIAPSELAADLPPGLDEVVLMAMASDPEERFQSSIEFRQALAGVAPRAAAMHESELSSLLVVAMADHIAMDKESLPSNLSGVTLDLPATESGGRAMEELTMGAIDVHITDSSEVSAIDRPERSTKMLDAGALGDDLHQQATQMVDPSSGEFDAEDERTVFQHDIEERMQEMSSGTPPAVMIPQGEPPPQGIHPALLAVIAMSLLIVAGGSSFGLVLALRDAPEETSPPIAVPPTSSVASEPVPDAVPEATTPDAGVVSVAVAPEPPAIPDAGPAEAVAAADPEPEPQTETPTETPTTGQRRGGSTGTSTAGSNRRGHGRGRGRGASGGGRRRGRPIASEW